MPRIALRLIDAKDMARAIVPHIATDTFTPAITNAALGGDLGSFVCATDRYSVGQYDLTNVLLDGEPSETMLIPRAALSWITTVGKASLVVGAIAPYVVVITTSTVLNVTRTVVEFVNDYRGENEQTHLLRVFKTLSGGNYPPVRRLFNEFEAGEQVKFGLFPEHVRKFTGYARIHRDLMQVTLPSKAGKPLHIRIGARFQGLLMPSATEPTQTNGDSKDADANTTPSAQG